MNSIKKIMSDKSGLCLSVWGNAVSPLWAENKGFSTAQQAFKGVRLTTKAHNTSILACLSYSLSTLPLFVLVNVSLRNSIYNQAQGTTVYNMLTEGGIAGWFPDLSSADPTFALPVTAIGLTYYSLNRGRRNPGAVADVLGYFQTGLLFLSPLILQLPSGVMCYWIPSTLYTLASSRVFQNPRVREYLNLTPTRLDQALVRPTLEFWVENTVKDVEVVGKYPFLNPESNTLLMLGEGEVVEEQKTEGKKKLREEKPEIKSKSKRGGRRGKKKRV